MAILITGGAGFIGSHTAVEFLNAGYDVVIADNYVNSSPKVLDRIREITGKEFRAYEWICATRRLCAACLSRTPTLTPQSTLRG